MRYRRSHDIKRTFSRKFTCTDPGLGRAMKAVDTLEPVFGDGAPGSAALRRPAVADLFYRARCTIFRMHDYQVKVTPGRVCLACHHCGKRSGGWEMSPPMGLARPSARIADSALEQVPIRMAKVLHHSPRPMAERQSAAS